MFCNWRIKWSKNFPGNFWINIEFFPNGSKSSWGRCACHFSNRFILPVFPLISVPSPQRLFNFEAWRFSAYWRTVLKKGKHLTQTIRNYSHFHVLIRGAFEKHCLGVYGAALIGGQRLFDAWLYLEEIRLLNNAIRRKRYSWE